LKNKARYLQQYIKIGHTEEREGEIVCVCVSVWERERESERALLQTDRCVVELFEQTSEDGSPLRLGRLQDGVEEPVESGRNLPLLMPVPANYQVVILQSRYKTFSVVLDTKAW